MRILIVTHAREVRPISCYFISLLAERWIAAGHSIETLRGPGSRPSADVAFQHVDLTVVGDEYRQLLAHYPLVLNRAVQDISKRTISRHLLAPNDRWAGPVIVKTDLNSRGRSELLLRGHRWPADPFRLLPRRLASRAAARLARADSPFRSYQVYPSMTDVPRRIWRHPAFVVERFLAEPGEEYSIRRLYLLGSRHVNLVFRSPEPIASGVTQHDPRVEAPPPALLARCAEIGIGYGRVDYLMIDGTVALLDANPTPGMFARNELFDWVAGQLAPALNELVLPPTAPSMRDQMF